MVCYEEYFPEYSRIRLITPRSKSILYLDIDVWIIHIFQGFNRGH